MPLSTGPWPGLSTRALTTSGWVNDARIPENRAVPKIARNGGTWIADSTISRTSGSRFHGVMWYTAARASRAAAVSTPPDGFSANPRPKKIPTAATNDGPTVHTMPRMCWFTVTPPTRLGTKIVVSDSGDILSPMYAPEMTAPAVIAVDIFRTGAMPTNATPSVAAVVQELPLTAPTAAQMTAMMAKKMAGRSSARPYDTIVGIVPARFHVPISAPTASRMKIAPMAEATPPTAASSIAAAVWPFL